MISRLAVAMVAAWIASACVEAASKHPEVEVRISTTFWLEEGLRESEETLKCGFGPDRWLIASEDGFQATAILLEGATLTYRQQTTAIRTKHPDLLAGTQPDLMEDLGKVREHQQPFPELIPMRPLGVADAPWSLGQKACWLAFCSGSFFRKPERLLYPMSDLWKHQTTNQMVFTDRTLTFPDELGLPRFVELAGPGKEIWFQYAVGSTTKVGGITLPTRFQVIQYFRRIDGGMTVLMSVKGTVTSIREVERIEFETPTR
ncbi:MAG: hypothetical protein IT581_10800 [Verrucomicrobiales bacterium]|nr:hypothetical protein [Verrucomicrobiales bacterium]